jgi:adenylylsulfate kinase-like enzyme
MIMYYTDPKKQQDLRSQGYRLVFEKFGPPATGKTTEAEAKAQELQKQGRKVAIVDGLWEGTGGVRVFAK